MPPCHLPKKSANATFFVVFCAIERVLAVSWATLSQRHTVPGDARVGLAQCIAVTNCVGHTPSALGGGWHIIQRMPLATLSIDSASAITGLSRRTWWRRVTAAEVTRVADDARGRAMLLWDDVEPYMGVAMAPQDKQLACLADAGDAGAQNDMGQFFLIAGKPKAAFYWFQLAAQQNQPDAMQWLGHCYIHGQGAPQDDNLGMMWLAKAAAHGHVIAQGQMKGLLRTTV